jgi:hypothetical protein
MFQYPNFRGALVGSSAFRTDGRDVLEQQRTAVLQIFERGLQSFKYVSQFSEHGKDKFILHAQETPRTSLMRERDEMV